MTARKRKALRSRANGQLFPINEHVARHDDVEMVYLDEKGAVIAPEEVGPAAAMTLPEPHSDEGASDSTSVVVDQESGFDPDSEPVKDPGFDPVTEEVATTAADVAQAEQAAKDEAVDKDVEDIVSSMEEEETSAKVEDKATATVRKTSRRKSS